MTQCEHCGRDTPDEAFCTWCGAHRVGAGSDARAGARTMPRIRESTSASPVWSPLFSRTCPGTGCTSSAGGLVGGLAVVVALVAGA